MEKIKKQTIVLASDHAGFLAKKALIAYISKHHEVIDMGCHSEESCDYPDLAKSACQEILRRQCLGVLICGSGVGISIAANKHKGIRCALVHNSLEARLTRLHNNANVLAMGGRILGEELMKDILDAFLSTEFSNEERHLRRINKLELGLD